MIDLKKLKESQHIEVMTTGCAGGHDLEIPAKTLDRWIKIAKDHGRIEFKGSKKTGGYFSTHPESTTKRHG